MSDEMRGLLTRCEGSWGPIDMDPKEGYAICKAMGSDIALADAATLGKALRGSMDAAANLIQRRLHCVALTMDMDPSGEGASLHWWPEGLSGGKEIVVKSAASVASLAAVACLLRALLAQAEQEVAK